MTAAILTTLFFALSAICGQRIAFSFGGLRGNLLRLILSTLVLGVIVLALFRDSLTWPSFGWLFVSGLIGFGFGDVALFLAYERLGARLTILLNLCLAPVFAALFEWAWLGNTIPLTPLLAMAVILIGVILAIRPSTPASWRRGSFRWGVGFAICAGFGQGVGAVVSRKAQQVSLTLGIETNGIAEAFQRVLAGLMFAAIVVWWRSRMKHRHGSEVLAAPVKRTRADWWWLVGAALTGPVIGVSLFQWALATVERSAIVLAIVATTPLVLMPLAWWSEKDRPSPLAIVGAIIAVGAVVFLKMHGMEDGESP
jgi:drug/metabolite transporter (DMT)-like permease